MVFTVEDTSPEVVLVSWKRSRGRYRGVSGPLLRELRGLTDMRLVSPGESNNLH